VFPITQLKESDLPALRHFWQTHWGADFMVVRGRVFRPEQLEGFALSDGAEWLGLVTLYFEAFDCEIISLDSLHPGQGIGTALLNVALQAARRASCRIVKLVTTNDNTPALRFYQKHGFELAALRSGSIKQARKIKPSIPEFGLDGIPLRDEIELWLHLPAPNPDLCT